ncbi:MAG: acyl carrier protein [Ruminococcaceae bacterium]|nr:acyl carrier protein [Oscillospiraceae bacterium]
MKEKIKELLAKQLRVELSEINENTDIMDDLGADSLDIVEMLQTIETDFGLVIPDEDVQGLRTVGDVADYIEQHA